MRVLLTGGSGLVGGNVLRVASDRQVDVIAPSSSELDLLSGEAVKAFVQKTEPDCIVHAAGKVGGIQANVAAPYEFCMQNLKMGINIIDAAVYGNVPQVLNLGSSCMYPRAAKNPLKESDLLTGALEPTNEGYAVAKIAVAKLASYQFEQYQRQYKTIIPCNLYGYGDSFEENKSHMIPAVIRKIHQARVNGDKTVDIWGDGLARREFMFAADLADFIIEAIQRPEDLPLLCNVGVGSDYTINEYYQVVAEVIGYEGEFVHDLSKPSGMARKLVDVSLQSDFGWEPKTSLREGIEMTYKHYLEEVGA